MALHGAPAILPPPVPITTYCQKYRAKPDVLEGVYADYLLPDAPACALTPAQVLDATMSASEVIPKVFLVLFHDGGRLLTCTLHRPVRYQFTPTRPSPWDGRIFCFTSDIMSGGLITTVKFPPTGFYLTPASYIPNTASMDAAWGASDPTDLVLGPFADTDDEVTEMRTRNLCRVPHRYIPLVLGKRLTPRELWAQVGITVIQDGRENDCAVFLAWIRIACTARGAGLLPANCLGADALLTRPEMDPDLQRHRWNLVISDLPALTPSALGPADQMLAVVGALRADQATAIALAAANRDADRATAAAERAAAVAPRLPSAIFPTLITHIMLLCEVTSEADLPQLWHLWASAAKGERRQLFQQLVHTRARDPGAASSLPAVITKELFELTFQGRFGSFDLADLTAGLQPFQVSHAACGIGKEATTRAEKFDLTLQNLTAPSLQEQETLSNRVVTFPSNPYELDCTLCAFSVVVLDIILGTHHRLSHHYRVNFLQTAWSSTYHTFVAHATEFPTLGLAPLLMRHVQLEFVLFFNAVQVGVITPLPNMGALIYAVERCTWSTFPPVPSRYVVSTPRLLPTPPPLPVALPPAIPAALPPATRQRGETGPSVKVLNTNLNPAHKTALDNSGKPSKR